MKWVGKKEIEMIILFMLLAYDIASYPCIKYLPTSSIDHTIFGNWSLWNWICIRFVWAWYYIVQALFALCGFKVVVRANLYFSANKSFTNYRVLLTFLLLSIFQPLHENERKIIEIIHKQKELNKKSVKRMIRKQ